MVGISQSARRRALSPHKPDMSTDIESSEGSNLPLDYGSSDAPVKKTARKAAKKAAKKAARKTVAKKTASKAATTEPAQVSEAPAEVPAPKKDGEFRPSDFGGRGSHADEALPEPAVAENRETPSANGKEEPSYRQESPETARLKRHGDEDDDQQKRAQGKQNHQQGQNQNPNRKKGKKQPFQKGGKHQHKQGKHNQQGGKGQQGGWRQPPPPSERDYLEGELPAAASLAKKADCDSQLAELDSSNPIVLAELYELKVDPLIAAVKELGVAFEDKPGRKQALEGLFKFAREGKRVFKDEGFLDLTDAGHGFVVHPASNYQLKPESVFVPASLIKEYGLQRGHRLEVLAKAPEEGERCPAALRIASAMGQPPEEMEKVTPFEDLIPYYPTERLVLETPMPSNNKKDVSMRAFDLLTPIGFGQRGLIVAPPRTGKTVLLQGLANSIQENWPDAHLIVLLIDERPEEVTDFKRRVKGEVVSSTFDETATSHVHAAEMVVEKARRMVEQGEKVVILLDSITRLARAYNTLASNSGKIMSGGIEATALQKPKRFFGSARNIEDGGSLTIMGTALVDTGSKMDEVIYEEFKGTGNMETHLDRDLINKRIFPAINFERSGTRKEELLYHPQEMEKVHSLRRVMQGVPGMEAMEMLIKRLKVTSNNVEFLMSLK